VKNSLETMFRPKSVANLGASTNEKKIGGRPVRYLKHYEFDGPIYPVNPNAAEVQGLKAYKSILNIEGEVDLALIVLPATLVIQGVREYAMKLTLVNRQNLLEASKAKRFGPDWSGQRCLAKTRKGTLCQNPVGADRNRCRMHGGKSPEPRTPEGKARFLAANTKHGRRSCAHVEKVKAINAELRRITYELKRGGLIP